MHCAQSVCANAWAALTGLKRIIIKFQSFKQNNMQPTENGNRWENANSHFFD